MNAVEREPVETRVLNPTASEASYKPKQRSYRTTNLKKKVLAPNSPGAEMSGTEMSSAETAAPERTRPYLYGLSVECGRFPASLSAMLTKKLLNDSANWIGSLIMFPSKIILSIEVVWVLLQILFINFQVALMLLILREKEF